MAIAANLGFPRMGANRETKRLVENFWNGKLQEKELEAEAKKIRSTHLALQKDIGIDAIPAFDFSLYDHVLDMACLFGVIPERYRQNRSFDLAMYFAMARGVKGTDLQALEMTKWFDTNYHYIVPEVSRNQAFEITDIQIYLDLLEASSTLDRPARPVLIGPYSFLRLSKAARGDTSWDPIELLPALTKWYCVLFEKFNILKIKSVQIDEPCFVLNQAKSDWPAIQKAYATLKDSYGPIQSVVTTYFDSLHSQLSPVFDLPVGAVHLDLVRGPDQLSDALSFIKPNQCLSLGVVDGRNIWKNNFEHSLTLLESASNKIGSDRLIIAPSCSLIHTPFDLNGETHLDPELKSWMAFSVQKLEEVSILTQAINDGRTAVQDALSQNEHAIQSRRVSNRIHNPTVKSRLETLKPEDAKRAHEFTVRKDKQVHALNLPLFPTTTIGSFPQTDEIRSIRQEFKRGTLSKELYEAKMKDQIRYALKKQEEIGLDVLVHGEAERNDMVEYFGEYLSGFAFTENGWVQSYGSRCVKPPIIFGDVSRPSPMTVEWIQFAQSCTKKPVKGMLTGPVTILQWSFVRDDQTRDKTANQIALAIRDEAIDLEKAGIKIIQIDEPAIREGLPLRHEYRAEYLKWAVHAFKLSASGVKDETQIHTHMCYSEFNDMIESIGSMDADVITIEASRSNLELLDIFKTYTYPNDIGPGVYDIHSPRVPTVDEIFDALCAMTTVLSPDQIWVNPDCGLKTRKWEEVTPSLTHLVNAAHLVREKLNQKIA